MNARLDHFDPTFAGPGDDRIRDKIFSTACAKPKPKPPVVVSADSYRGGGNHHAPAPLADMVKQR
jgi:hypothetical protein